MIFYIMLPGDAISDCMTDINTLGEDNGFGVFWAGSGLKALMRIVDTAPEILPDISIIDASSKNYTVEQFLTRIDKLQIRIPQ
jgi:hypothetical protein